MKILMIGPYPPPHGGVSVHVALASRELKDAGICCRILNTNRRAAPSEDYIRVRGALDLASALLRHARSGWILHCHTNGHNSKSWLIALICGLAGRLGAGCVLTLHSGMAPAYLQSGARRRLVARLACSLFDRIVCPSGEVKDTLALLGIAQDRLEILPAFLPGALGEVSLPERLKGWMRLHKPLLSTALFFRPEYGFDLLVEALSRLRGTYPDLGCLVLGSGEHQEEARQLIARLSLEDSVLLAGDVRHDLCLAMISRSDLFVRPTWKDGDASSVREALWLGVSALASDASQRPPGTMLFRTGSVEDLVSKIEAALVRPAVAAEGLDGPARVQGIQKLLDIYHQLPAGSGWFREARASATR